MNTKYKIIACLAISGVFLGLTFYNNQEDNIELDVVKKDTVIEGSKINYQKYIKTAKINDNNAIKKVKFTKINNKELGDQTIYYSLEGKNKVVEKSTIISVEPKVEKVVTPSKKDLALPSSEKGKIFYVSDYQNADEAYQKASLYVRDNSISAIIKPIYKEGALRQPENLIGYQVELV